MKKLNLLTVLIMLVFASVSFGQITGSAHDFQGAGWNASGEICITCHTPHNSDGISDTPLWNHELTDVAQTYTIYSNIISMDATMGQPDGSSKLCLSCHDGTVAVDNFGSTTTGTNFIGAMGSGLGLLGTDLSNDHPISFVYDASLATTDGELNDPTTQSSGITGGTTIDADMLSGTKMQCSSCHDVHNAGFAKLLVKENSASALCLTCHIK